MTSPPGSMSKQADKRWYDTNIAVAEKLFFEHLEKQRKAEEEATHKEKLT